MHKTEQRKKLKTFIYKTLVLRLVIVAISVATVISVISYYKIKSEFVTEIKQLADNRTRLFASYARNILDTQNVSREEAIKKTMEFMDSVGFQQQSGSFSYAEFYTPDNERLEFFLGELKNTELETYVKDQAYEYPEEDDFSSTIVEIDNKSHIYLVTDIKNREGKPAVYLRLLYTISDKVISGLRRDLVETILYVFGIVFLTSLLLYPVIVNLMKKLAEYSSNLLDSNLESLKLLGSAIAKRDSDTDAHNYRVTLYSVKLAEAIQLDQNTISELIKGAFLHDVGKIGVRDNILLKPGKLDEGEFEIMKTHVDHGIDIVNRSHWLETAIDVVGSHHEKFDGSGYPKGLSGEDIPITARIFAIADVFDALASKRPYKEPFTLEQSLNILIEGKGSHFDPELVDVFSNIAENLYEKYVIHDDTNLHDELSGLTLRYFSAGIEVLQV